MYSVYGDTVLDPFWGTGTTSIAAMAAARNSVGHELDEGFISVFEEDVGDIKAISERVAETRLARHEAFVEARRADGETFAYDAEHYDVPVRTKQERRLRLYTVESVEETEDGYDVAHVESA
jgi:hypothetical protein